MMSPGSSLALLILGIIAFVGLVYWVFKSQIGKFIETVLAYKRKQADAEQAEPDSGTSITITTASTA